MQNTLSPQDYMKEYREKITAKKQELQEKRKDEIFSVLETDWVSHDVKNKETEVQIKQDLRTYVQELKSTKEHKEQVRKYHKDMKKVKDFFSIILDTKNPKNKDKIKNMFAANKKYFQWVDSKNREKNQKILEKFFNSIDYFQRKDIMEKIEGLMKDPKAFALEMQQIIDSKPKMWVFTKIGEIAKESVSSALDIDMTLWIGIWALSIGGYLTSFGHNEQQIVLGAMMSLLWIGSFGLEAVVQWKDLNERLQSKRVEESIK